MLAELAAKKVDIVIGTHRLLSPDVGFTDLGLIIVDEEHRFGVKHKERLKQLQARDRRAHAHRDADSAHAAPVARRPARHDADADAAARPLAGAHVRRAVGRRR